jgi:hypothetical protein
MCRQPGRRVASLDLVFVGRFVILPRGQERVGPNETDNFGCRVFHRAVYAVHGCASIIGDSSEPLQPICRDVTRCRVLSRDPSQSFRR